ncbi:MAG: hypothetical protein SH856_00350 [Flavobacteriales bacterium]|nr:hypothetical protein [Flavobacteriales bacterium]
MNSKENALLLDINSRAIPEKHGKTLTTTLEIFSQKQRTEKQTSGRAGFTSAGSARTQAPATVNLSKQLREQPSIYNIVSIVIPIAIGVQHSFQSNNQ